MARTAPAPTKRPRISVEVSPTLLDRLRVAAAMRNVSVGAYVGNRVREDLDDEDSAGVLSRRTDPLLAGVWDNARDAAYDRD